MAAEEMGRDDELRSEIESLRAKVVELEERLSKLTVTEEEWKTYRKVAAVFAGHAGLPEGLREDRAAQFEVKPIDVLSSAISSQHGLPAHIEEEFARLDAADDEILRLASQSRLSPEAARQLEELHWKRQREGLTRVEAQTAANLLEQCERAMLIRARAAVIWKQRGHDPSELIIAR